MQGSRTSPRRSRRSQGSFPPSVEGVARCQRGLLPLFRGGGESPLVEGGRSMTVVPPGCLLEPWLEVADVRGSQRFSFPAQWLKPPRVSRRTRAEEMLWPRGVEGLVPVDGHRVCSLAGYGTPTSFCGSMDYRCRALPRRRGQLWPRPWRAMHALRASLFRGCPPGRGHDVLS